MVSLFYWYTVAPIIKSHPSLTSQKFFSFFLILWLRRARHAMRSSVLLLLQKFSCSFFVVQRKNQRKGAENENFSTPAIWLLAKIPLMWDFFTLGPASSASPLGLRAAPNAGLHRFRVCQRTFNISNGASIISIFKEKLLRREKY